MTLARGFTLVEILVAFLIFAIIGVISSQLLSQTVTAHERLTDRGSRLADTHRAMQIIQRDVLQITYRPIRDEYDSADRGGYLIIDADGGIEFSRVGWRNPLLQPRAEVQRVAYRVEDGELIRAYWHVLDRAPDSEPAYQTLLREVEQLEFVAVDVSGNEYNFWPVAGQNLLDPSRKLAGIIMRVELPPFGVVERVWEIPDLTQPLASGLPPGSGS